MKTLEPMNLPCDGDFWSYYEKMKNKPVYVILGSQGSGTNLLSNLLRKVFRFSVVHDRSLIFNAACTVLPLSQPKRIQQAKSRVYNSLFPGVIRRPFLRKAYFRQAANYLGIENHLAHAKITSAAELANFFYCYHAFVNRGEHKAIKSDDLWERIHCIDEVLPNRRYILLVRDPRDNAISIMNKPFGPCEIYSASQYVRKRLRIHRNEAEKNAAHSITVHYETLLAEPEIAAGALASFIGISPPRSSPQLIQNLNIRTSNSEKWRRLPLRELQICEAILYRELEAFGYASELNPTTPVARSTAVKRRFIDGCRRIPQKLKGKYNLFVSK